MVEKGPYGILPFGEVDKLKKQIEDLKKKSASSQEILDAVNRLTSIIESMLHLFEGAAAGMKREGKNPLGKKLDKVIDQNETIAGSILSLADMIKELKPRRPYNVREKPQPVIPPEPVSMPPPDFSVPPSFESPRPIPLTPPMGGPTPRQSPVDAPPMPPKQGPVPMPTGSFKDLEFGAPPSGKPMVPDPTQGPLWAEKPKKGLFGKLRK